MFTLNPASLGLADPAFPPSRSSYTAPKSTTKLKDSCHNCAKAKLRCSKEKPTCSRCAKRSKACQYFATKRAGRKRISSLNSSSSTESSNSMQCALTPYNSPQTETTASLYLDILSGLGSPNESVSMPITEASYPPSIDLFGSWVSLPPLPLTDTTIVDCQIEILDNYPGSNDFLNLNFIPPSAKSPKATLSTTSVELFSGATIPPGASSPPGHQLLDTKSTELPSDPGSHAHLPSCMSRAADILSRLCSHSPMEYINASNTGVLSKGVYKPPKTEHIVKDSGRIIEAVNGILQCPCSRDGCVLVVMYLIVFKVLDRYASAAQKTLIASTCADGDVVDSPAQHRSHSHHQQQQQQHDPTPHPPGDSRGIHDRSRACVAGQLIVGEIHHVQRLVNVLSQRLRGIDGHMAEPGDVDSSLAVYRCGTAGRRHSLDLPPTILAQAELDLRNRLCGLSVRLANVLKRE